MLNPVPQQHAPGPASHHPGGLLPGSGPERIRTADYIQPERTRLPTLQSFFFFFLELSNHEFNLQSLCKRQHLQLARC